MTRVAIVGTGTIAGIHATALAELDAELVAAADTDETRLKAFGAAHRVPALYGDLDQLLAHERPDLVHVCTPPWLHREQALACLRAGVNVLIEKPPALNLRELDEITAAATGPPWFATVFQHRFGSGQRRLKALIASKVAGRPLLAICHTTWFRDQAYFDVPWRGRFETEGGGPTMGHGIHQMDLLLDALGDWTRVSALTRTQARRTATEDVSLAHVEFASGAVASVVNSLVSPREESYLRFDFERATVELTHVYGYGDEDWRITTSASHANSRDFRGYSNENHGSLAEAVEAAEGGWGGVRSGHGAQFAAVYECLRAGLVPSGMAPPVTPGEARRTLSLVAGIYASAATGRPVTPEDLAPGTPFYKAMNGAISRSQQ
jgi:predicted dehydrogenase